jgi:hypothetical protein
MNVEDCRKMGLANKGKKRSEETKRKMSIARQNRITSNDTKRKISESQKGHIVSEEQKKKIGKGVKRSWARKKIPNMTMEEVELYRKIKKSKRFLTKVIENAAKFSDIAMIKALENAVSQEIAYHKREYME